MSNGSVQGVTNFLYIQPLLMVSAVLQYWFRLPKQEIEGVKTMTESENLSSQFSCSPSQDDFPVLAISADGHHKRNHACLKATQLPGSPIQHFTNHYSVTFIVLKYWPLPVSHA